MSFDIWHAIFNVVNFLLFIILVVKFGGPAVVSNLDERRKAVLEAIKDATEANKAAVASLAETKARLSGVDGELAGMLEDAKRIGAMQAAALEEAGKAEAERLRAAAKAEIERQRQAAVQDVRALLMRQAFERAALELQQSMTADRQRELVNGLIQKVGDGSLALK
jgi:F-type H+-transporting ATPase subunit b